MPDATFVQRVVLPADPTSAMHAATKQYVDAATSGGMLVPLPAGSVASYAGSTPPNGWLLCNGQAVNRVTYAALYAAIGTTYGAGDGSTTFNLPDLRGRTIAGPDDMGSSDAGRLNWSNALGTAGGAQTHTLTLAELTYHDHGSTTIVGDHTHGLVVATNTSTSGSGRRVTGGSGTIGDATAGAGSHYHNTNAAGGGGAHNNMQPTMLLNWIISTGVGISAPTTAQVTVSGTAPVAPNNGDIWVDTSTPTWITPTSPFSNGWSNYDGGFAPFGYMKDANGFVHLRGLVKNTSATTAAIYTLPAGYRPTGGQEIFIVQSGGGVARVDVRTTGAVNVEAWLTGGYTHLSLANVVFATF